MQQRAINVVLTGVTGTALAGMLVAGVAAASDDSAPQKQFKPERAVAAQEHKAPRQDALKAPEKKQPAAKPEAKPAEKPAVAKDSNNAKKGPKALLSGKTTSSYFWDDGSGVRGDTGAPASGKPMQKGMFASPSWPMLTKVRVTYKGRSITGFVGDRGPGEPSHRGVMLDLDTYTFRYLLDGKKPASKYNAGTGEGHLKGVKWEVLSWGSGAGKKGKPRPFGS
ncbi:hypothetical protein [Actinomadura madurae]|uniref:hypothetical protein n=1 Tax=Actinomadura madurae TaxID=1993 RepID=UPI002026B6F9|nr:hypothetical protein [Actinomadura madurae]MCP9955853.1 hypothetical protein [Actinomadura madurae]MCP9985096.1 hypothetical protein [Actinomadura madurae]MCQ0003340.1 hypothetical protein [Actinomadura madurae]MCQ0021311.1 hypothetical protein [Actinomadura madurae]URN03430.1 hypothetical protein LUW74_08810 [Actinomadura madurae]